MVFKLKAALGGLIFIACLLIFIMSPAELAVPLPKNSLKISEKTNKTWPVKSVIRVYRSSLAQEKVDLFFKKEMPRAGWKGGKNGLFTKGNYIAVITVNSLKDPSGKNDFTKVIINIITKDKFSSLPKSKPDKVNFMPVYPGSVQLSLWNSSAGVVGSYETESSIKEVVFFYKSGMLKYGWRLDSETPVSTINSKVPSSIASTARFVFRRKDSQRCSVIITSISIVSSCPSAKSKSDMENLLRKTIISFIYNSYQRIK